MACVSKKHKVSSMKRIIKLAFIVLCVCVLIFIMLVILFVVFPDLNSFPVLEFIIGLFIILDIFIGATSFLVAVSLAFIEFFRNKYVINNSVKLIAAGVLVSLAALFGYVFNEYHTFVAVKSTQENTAKSPSLNPSPIALEKEPEESKHGYQSGPIIHSKTESYFVRGSDREVLCEQIIELAKRIEGDIALGYITYKMTYNYNSLWTQQGYTIGSFNVTAVSILTVPQWESSGGASDDTKNDWRRFKNAVKEHEDTHQRILVEKASKLVSTYNNLGYYPTEAELNSAVERFYSTVSEELKDAQNNFDENFEPELLKHFCQNH